MRAEFFGTTGGVRPPQRGTNEYQRLDSVALPAMPFVGTPYVGERTRLPFETVRPVFGEKGLFADDGGRKMCPQRVTEPEDYEDYLLTLILNLPEMDREQIAREILILAYRPPTPPN